MNICEKISNELHVKPWQVDAVIGLLDEGNTVPFIARYRKEKHGELDDQQIRIISEKLVSLRSLEQRRSEILSSMEKLGVLTDEIRIQMNEADTLSRLEDLYRPYRPKRKTRASIAKEKGLEPLADRILLQLDSADTEEKLASGFYGPGTEVPDAGTAVQGALDIIAEKISDDPEIRSRLKELYRREARICSQATDEEDQEQIFRMYYQYSELIRTIPPHRILAMNRGEKEKKLKITIETDKNKVLRLIQNEYVCSFDTLCTQLVKSACEDAYDRLIAPSLYTEIRHDLTDHASAEATNVFADNLKHLLMQAPIKGKIAMGLDPGIRTGCKVAVVDEMGTVLDTDVIYPLPAHGRVAQSREKIKNKINRFGISIVAIGNGTAGRETEAFFVDVMKDLNPENKVGYMIVNEAGASVYSASELGAEEFPNYDVSLRSAVSIARRLQDPLAELVKIEPRSIGIGQYQHDLKEKELDEALDHVVEDCVNAVGVDVNTASYTLLSHIAGINQTIARNIVAYREENGPFKTRSELKKVSKLGAKSFEQCAGFLRIVNGKKPIENTGVHPESYAVAEKLLAKYSLSPKEAALGLLKIKAEETGYSTLAAELDTGEPTVRDIVKELSKPGRDPRDDLPKPFLKSDILTIDDLQEGMHLMGTVRNVTDFGAFVDIGVHQDGLVHISQMAERRIRHPSDVVHVGDIIDVWVLKTENRKRISLTMKKPQK